jgi:hypothetical protein
VAATSTRSIAWLPNWSTLSSHHSRDVEPPDVDGSVCVEVSSHAPRSVWACSPVHSGEGDEKQADAEGDGGRNNQ